MAIFYIIPVLLGIYYGRKNKNIRYFTIILFVQYFGIVIPYTVLTMNLLAMGYAMLINKKIVKETENENV
jgi:hypothetical protein